MGTLPPGYAEAVTVVTKGIPNPPVPRLGEKFLNFLRAFDRHPALKAELPKFVTEIKTVFEPWEIREYLSGVRRLGPLAHTMGEEEFEEFRAAGAVVEDVVGAAEDAILSGCACDGWPTMTLFAPSRFPNSESREAQTSCGFAPPSGTNSQRVTRSACAEHRAVQLELCSNCARSRFGRGGDTR